jgi:hypothetical protein
MDYQYTYLIGGLILLVIWASLYLYKREGRKEMLFISLLFGIAGIFSELVYVQDWWRPVTITNSLVGIEDFLVAFLIGGIASTIYSRGFKKKIKKGKTNFPKLKYRYIGIMFILIFFVSFLLFKNSFYSSIAAFVFGMSGMWLKRRDLILTSIISGVLTLMIGLVTYFILIIIQPEFIKQFWYIGNEWYSGLLFGIPIKEYIWYFLAGMFAGPLYEYLLGKKLKNIKR